MAARRVSLPTADDLFRPTADGTDRTDEGDQPSGGTTAARGGKRTARPKAVPEEPEQSAVAERPRRSSGRVRHDEKMTVYVTADELLDIEHARLALRREHGLAVDRGRLVREALSIVLADLDERGDDSELVRRLLG